MASIRTFVAIETPELVRRDLHELQDKLNKSNADVRWEPIDKLHATIKFLGNVEENLLPAILARIQASSEQVQSCEVIFETLGCFPDKKRPRIVWVGCTNPDGGLQSLKSMLDKELSAFGFEIEQRPFQPHITLGRVKSQKGIQHLISMMENLTFEPHSSVVREVLLMKSVLQSKGSEYSTLQKIQLKP